MKKITGHEFIENIINNPSWCLGVKEPIEITTHVSINNIKITHLSPLLHFKGENVFGTVASFAYCLELKEATGNFYGCVNFEGTNIEKTTNLKVLTQNKRGWSAIFYGCRKLKVLEGEYQGAVDIQESGVEEINAKIKGVSKKNGDYKAGVKVFAKSCPHLKINTKFASSYYDLDEDFKKKCIRASLNRFPTI